MDELEFVGIADNTARINALIAGDINVLLQLDQKATRLIDNSGVGYVINAPSGAFLNLAMMLDREPTNNPDFRLAVKYAIDREGIRDNILKGLGSVGNDHPIAPIDPYYNDAYPQRTYDPDKARFPHQEGRAGKYAHRHLRLGCGGHRARWPRRSTCSKAQRRRAASTST